MHIASLHVDFATATLPISCTQAVAWHNLHTDGMRSNKWQLHACFLTFSIVLWTPVCISCSLLHCAAPFQGTSFERGCIHHEGASLG